MKIEPIKIIKDYTAPTPSGWKKTKYGWMENEPEIVLIQKVNQLIEIINNEPATETQG